MGKYFLKTLDASTLEQLDYDRVVLDVPNDKIIWNYGKKPYYDVKIILNSSSVGKDSSTVTATVKIKEGYSVRGEITLERDESFTMTSEDFGINDTGETVDKEAVFTIEGKTYRVPITHKATSSYVATNMTKVVWRDGTSKSYPNVFSAHTVGEYDTWYDSVDSQAFDELFETNTSNIKEIYFGNDLQFNHLSGMNLFASDALGELDVIALPLIVDPEEFEGEGSAGFPTLLSGNYGSDPVVLSVKEIQYEGTYGQWHEFVDYVCLDSIYECYLNTNKLVFADGEYEKTDLVEWQTYDNGYGFNTGTDSVWEVINHNGYGEYQTFRCKEGVSYIDLAYDYVVSLYVPSTAFHVYNINSGNTIYYNGTVDRAKKVFHDFEGDIICSDGETYHIDTTGYSGGYEEDNPPS